MILHLEYGKLDLTVKSGVTICVFNANGRVNGLDSIILNRYNECWERIVE